MLYHNHKLMSSITLLSIGMLLFLQCSPDKQDTGNTDIAGKYAVVRSVSVTGSEQNYTFSVELKSPDLGCNQYANWWEVLTEDGNLAYRRILAHSHANEQPFKRSGGPVKVNEDEMLIIRAHMHPGGYGSGNITLKGNVKTGFKVYDVPEGFATDIEKQSPQPSGCAF